MLFGGKGTKKNGNSQAFFSKTYGEKRLMFFSCAPHEVVFRCYERALCVRAVLGNRKNNPPIPLIPHVRFIISSVG